MHADRLVKGAPTWEAVTHGLIEQMKRNSNPIKRAAMLNKAIAYLKAVPQSQAIHLDLMADVRGKRTVELVFGTYSLCSNPLHEFREEVLSVRENVIM